MFIQFLVLLVMPAIAVGAWENILGRMSPYAWNAYRLTGALGSPIHEISHALVCLIFRMPIEQMALYTPNGEGGCLGYVKFRYNPASLLNSLGLALQGVAPLITGSVATYLLLGEGFGAEHQAGGMDELSWMFSHSQQTLTSLWNLAITGIGGSVLAIGLLIVCMHAIPSWADVKVGLRGMVLITLFFSLMGAALEIAQSSMVFQPPWTYRLISVIQNGAAGLLHVGLAGAINVVLLSVVGGAVLIIPPTLAARAGGAIFGAGRSH